MDFEKTAILYLHKTLQLSYEYVYNNIYTNEILLNLCLMVEI